MTLLTLLTSAGGGGGVPTAVSLSLAKLHLHVTHDDEDTLIAAYIAAAQNYIERFTGQLMTRRSVTQGHSAFETAFPLYMGPSPDTVVVTYLDADDADQEIADARVVRDRLYAPSSSGWPTAAGSSVVTIEYTAGFEDDEVPADLIAAQLLLIGHWYANREAIVVGDNTAIEAPLAVRALAEQFKVPTI